MAHLTRREETVRIPVRAKAALHESGIRLIASNTSCQLSMEASWPVSYTHLTLPTKRIV